MSESITGGCLCGAVRYEITAEPQFGGKCYCEDCRKTGGAGHCAVAGVPDAGVSVTGELTSYERKGGSGQPIVRKFCPKCGSQVMTIAAAMPGITMIKAATFDDPEKFHSHMSIFVSRAPSWDQPQAGEQTFPELPPQPA